METGVTVDVERAILQAQRYWYADGLVEGAVGANFLLIGLLFFAESWLPAGPLAGGLSALGLPVVVLAGAWLARRAIAAAKERLTYPRTGYVSYARPKPRPRRNALLAGAVAATVFAVSALLTTPRSLDLIPALEGLLIGAFWLYLGHRLQVTRFYLVGLASALIGAAAAAACPGLQLAVAAYFGGFGGVLALSGGITLLAYLRQTRPLVEV